MQGSTFSSHHMYTQSYICICNVSNKQILEGLISSLEEHHGIGKENPCYEHQGLLFALSSDFLFSKLSAFSPSTLLALTFWVMI